MIFFAGMLTGAVLALISVWYLKQTDTHQEETEETSAESERLNREKRERARIIKEQERQHNNMMTYTGKEQKRA